MSLLPGHFRLHTHVDPAMKAGDYRFSVTQSIDAQDDTGAVASASLPVIPLDTYVRVTSPRYQLPPDQILSTFPPAGTEGSYGARLPQVVIKRRTLPWERTLAGAPPGTPWLALVVFTDAEATLQSNVPVSDCVTAGVDLSGTVDVPTGACLEIKLSVVHRIMPTRKDVPLLAHAREVDVNDTELMMGDDDGFLAVVIANRLPLSGRNPDGSEAPLKYYAALVNLEGQFDQLLPESPPSIDLTEHLVLDAVTVAYSTVEYDHMAMDTRAAIASLPGPEGIGGGPLAETMGSTAFRSTVSTDVTPTPFPGTGAWGATVETFDGRSVGEQGLGYVSLVAEFLDPTLRFPVLAQWSFTSWGDLTFETLMRDRADSGLLGTMGTEPKPVLGRPPLEVVETGHVGIDQRTRRGDVVRAWYRGPLLPHPADTTGARLQLAHTGDQLRAVIPDGREDLSLAAAFEIGRLLALSQPSMVAALLRWRQIGYQAARSTALWSSILAGLDLHATPLEPGRGLGAAMGRGLVMALTANPAETIGPPRELFTAGSPMQFEGDPLQMVTRGLGIDVATDVPMPGLLGEIQAGKVPTQPLAELPAATVSALLRGALGQVRDASLVTSVAGAFASHVVAPVGMPRAEDAGPPEPDALDRALGVRAPADEEGRS